MFGIIARMIGTLVKKPAIAGIIFLGVPLETYFCIWWRRVIYMTAFIVTRIGVSSEARYQ